MSAADEREGFARADLRRAALAASRALRADALPPVLVFHNDEHQARLLVLANRIDAQEARILRSSN